MQSHSPDQDNEALPIDSRVVLTRDKPEVNLHRGDEGVVRSTWCEPHLLYEVEFSLPGRQAGNGNPTRTLVAPAELAPAGERLHG